MKTRMIVILCGVALIAIVLILNFTGILTWQKMAIVFAAAVAPLKHLSSWLKGSTEKIDEVRVAHNKLRKAEDSYRKGAESELAKDKVKLENINQELTEVNAQKDSLEVLRADAHKILQNVSDEELLKAVKKTLGKQ